MNEQRGQAPEIRRVTDVPCNGARARYPHYGNLCLVEVVHGQGRLLDATNQFDLPDGRKGLYRCITLDGKKLVQIRDAENPVEYGYGKIAPGEGLEHIDCEELQQVSEAFSSIKPYAGFDDAVEKMGPLLGLLRSGYYMVVEVHTCPTNGGGRSYWDIDGVPREFPPFQRRWDQYDHGTHPKYLYPSKWPSCLSEEALEAADTRFSIAEDKQPRTIAYALSNNVALVLDGHKKALLHQEYFETAPTLVIIPHMRTDDFCEDRRFHVFADLRLRAEGLDSTPTYVHTDETEFTTYPVERNPYWKKESSEGFSCFPRAEVYSGEMRGYLAANCAHLSNFHADEAAIGQISFGYCPRLRLPETADDAALYGAVCGVVNHTEQEKDNQERIAEQFWWRVLGNGKTPTLEEAGRYHEWILKLAGMILCAKDGLTLSDYEKIKDGDIFSEMAENQKGEGENPFLQLAEVLVRLEIVR